MTVVYSTCDSQVKTNPISLIADVFFKLLSQLWYDLSGTKFHLGGQTIHVATPLNMVTFYSS